MKTPNLDRVNPATCVNGKLRRLHKMVDQIYGLRLRPFGLRGSMLSMLFIIGKFDGVNQKFLAERLVLDASTVSRDLSKLKSKGWVQIIAGDDAREREIFMTDTGYEFLEKVSPVWEEVHHRMEQLLGQFSIDQIDAVSTKIKMSLDDLV